MNPAIPQRRCPPRPAYGNGEVGAATHQESTRGDQEQLWAGLTLRDFTCGDTPRGNVSMDESATESGCLELFNLWPQG
jgi:hypothetical protein